MSDFSMSPRLAPGPLARIVRNGARDMATGADSPGVEALLAEILRTQPRVNGQYLAYPYTVASGFMQQIIPYDENRTALILAVPNLAVTPPLPSYLFEQGPNIATAMDSSVLPRCMVAPQNQQLIFYTVPTNAITVVAQFGANVSGVIFVCTLGV